MNRNRALGIVVNHVKHTLDQDPSRTDLLPDVAALRSVQKSWTRGTDKVILRKAKKFKASARNLHTMFDSDFVRRAFDESEATGDQEDDEKIAENARMNAALTEYISRHIATKGVVDARNSDGDTLLIKAVKVNNIKAVELLLRHGADPNKPGRHRKRPLHWIASDDSDSELDEKLMRLLLDHRADPNVVDDKGRTPLHRASMIDMNDHCIELLLKYGAKVDAIDSYGRTPLLYAVRKDLNANPLLEHGADVTVADNEGKTALMYAIAHATPHGPHGHADAIFARVLIERGANPKAIDAYGKSVFMYAQGKPQILKELGKAGVPIWTSLKT
jgi:ankyrin repeat protein